MVLAATTRANHRAEDRSLAANSQSYLNPVSNTIRYICNNTRAEAVHPQQCVEPTLDLTAHHHRWAKSYRRCTGLCLRTGGFGQRLCVHCRCTCGRKALRSPLRHPELLEDSCCWNHLPKDWTQHLPGEDTGPCSDFLQLVPRSSLFRGFRRTTNQCGAKSLCTILVHPVCRHGDVDQPTFVRALVTHKTRNRLISTRYR